MLCRFLKKKQIKEKHHKNDKTFKMWIKDRMDHDTVNGDIGDGDDHKPDSDLPF